jgi:hypothetical protein
MAEKRVSGTVHIHVDDINSLRFKTLLAYTTADALLPLKGGVRPRRAHGGEKGRAPMADRRCPKTLALSNTAWIGQ